MRIPSTAEKPGPGSGTVWRAEDARDPERSRFFHKRSLVLLASHIGIREILTVDRRDFEVYRLLDGRELVQVHS